MPGEWRAGKTAAGGSGAAAMCREGPPRLGGVVMVAQRHLFPCWCVPPLWPAVPATTLSSLPCCPTRPLPACSQAPAVPPAHRQRAPGERRAGARGAAHRHRRWGQPGRRVGLSVTSRLAAQAWPAISALPPRPGIGTLLAACESVASRWQGHECTACPPPPREGPSLRSLTSNPSPHSPATPCPVDNTTDPNAWVPENCRQSLCLAVFGVSIWVRRLGMSD